LYVFIAISVVCFVGGMIVAFDLAEAVKLSNKWKSATQGAGLLLVLLAYAGLFATIVLMPILKYTGIYVKSCTKKTLVLNHVSSEFAARLWADASNEDDPQLAIACIERVQTKLKDTPTWPT
jgi:hypothetical protein